MGLIHLPGVNFGVSADASTNGEEVDVDGAVSYFDDDDELVGDDDGFAPNGKQRLRFAGR